MGLLYFWTRENYETDVPSMDEREDLELEQNSPSFAQASPGETLWAFLNDTAIYPFDIQSSSRDPIPFSMRRGSCRMRFSSRRLTAGG